MDCGCSRMRKIDVGVSIFATRRKTDLMLTCLPSSLIIDELKGLQASNNAPIAYYYCDYRTQVTQPLTLALGHILRLLVERLSCCQDHSGNCSKVVTGRAVVLHHWNWNTLSATFCLVNLLISWLTQWMSSASMIQHRQPNLRKYWTASR